MNRRGLLSAALGLTLALPAARAGDAPSAAARRGLDLLTRTPLLLPAYAGKRLSCTNCHLDGGRRAEILPLTAAAKKFPLYRAREGRIVTLEDRGGQCFLRSLNGKIPPHDSAAMRDILAYLDWLSENAPPAERAKKPAAAAPSTAGPPDAGAGAALYASRCVRCHGRDGAGLKDPDPDVQVPPLWGAESFNIGAGMARLHTAERFIRRSMPQGAEGTLTDQQARDVAEFVLRQPRPDFAAKSRDWPKGGKPEDARY